MDIAFKTAKMAKVFNSERDLDREYGKQADVIKRRMAVLRVAATLDRVSHLPPERCHELQPFGNGLYAVDLKHPWRLVFAVGNDPIPGKDDGGVDKTKVTAIDIRSVEDYH
jgi:proteic killer suppression protein